MEMLLQSRDPLGIRPGFYFEDDEVVAVASERAPLMTVFEKEAEQVSGNQAWYHTCGSSKWRTRNRKFCGGPSKANRLLIRTNLFFSRKRSRHLFGKKDIGSLVGSSSFESHRGRIFPRAFSVMFQTPESAYYGFMEQLQTGSAG